MTNEKPEEKQVIDAESKLEQEILGIDTAPVPLVNRERLIGLIIVLCFFGGFGLWAYLAPLESAAIALGKVIVAGSRRTIQHLEGGIIKKIYVRDGTPVKKGELLIKLDAKRPEISAELAKNQVLEFLAVEARLLAEIYGKDKVAFTDQLLKNMQDLKVKQIVDNQRALFFANKRTFEGSVAILKQRTEQLHQQIEGTQAQLVATKQQLVLINQELKDVKNLYAKRLVERSRLLALQREARKLEGSRGDYMAKVATLRQKIGETKIQIITIADKRRKELLSELRETQQKLSEALEQEKATTDVLERTDVRAPITGTVVGLKVHTVGGVIKPGETLMDIVPKHEMLVIEANVNPLDIDVVHPGLTAKIQMTALKMRTTPMLLGKVIYVSADAFQDERNNNSYYKARIEISEKELQKIKDQSLYPGMPVAVMIITNKLTPWQYFSEPVRRSFGRAFRED